MADEDGEPTAQAFLFFGAPFYKPESWSGEYAWHDELARARGWLPEPSPGASFEEKHGIWVESRKKLEHEPCTIRYSAYRPFVCVRRLLIVADHADPIRIVEPWRLDSTPADTAALIEFCRLLRIDYDHGFGWHLAAFYG